MRLSHHNKPFRFLFIFSLFLNNKLNNLRKSRKIFLSSTSGERLKFATKALRFMSFAIFVAVS